MPSIGGPVMGKDFFNRDRELNHIRKLLMQDNVLLISPRRYGKTSLMREVERKLCVTNRCLFLDVMYVDEPREFMIELGDAFFSESSSSMKEKLIKALKGVFAKIEEIEGSVMGSGMRIKFRSALKDEIDQNNWTQKGADVFGAITQASDSKPVYVLIDELSECVNNIIETNGEDARKFLQWFRSMRQRNTRELRFLASGSISFDKVVQKIQGSALIDDFARVYVEGFSKDEALKFTRQCLSQEGLEYKEEIGEKILECIGEDHIPYFISILINMIIEEVDQRLDKDLVEKVYNEKLLGVYGKGYFDYYRQRLKTYPGDMAKAAEGILRAACLSDVGYPVGLAFNIFRKETGTDDHERFMSLISDLETDFYIRLYRRKIRFRSKVLRDWWRLYYV